ncbi:Sodium-coupled monocarboxylate transporter 2 [Frankliniella fusca]|uniref:Sodium-coupled monocarboxylate transporter 2 n=1 Tax=Frankliniella fusca TaxID=407009 RepID=A0AAE1HSY8_9NEOP|nr:Sodium-coupled monocarboxylate transporter 2 [Frankliniella fusca]
MEPEKRFFGWEDYTVFACMLVISTLIGLYHGVKFRIRLPWMSGGSSSSSGSSASDLTAAAGRQEQQSGPSDSSAEEFLMGRGQMGTLPVALSMLASFLSSITLMGQPAEVYLFGPQLWLFGVAAFLAIPVVNYVMIPFFHKMQLTSAYEYFGKRFGRKVQRLASVLFTIQMILYLALVLYAPALALSQVTGLHTLFVVTAMYFVVIFYTTIGGMKAVVWTDTFQVVVLYVAMLAVLIKGTIDIGGFGVVWETNAQNGRGDLFKWTTDPAERYSVWTTLVGAALLHTAVYGANQLQVQRYLTVPSIAQARRMVWINCVGWTVVVLLTVYAGMLIFAKYALCDPISAGRVSKADQLFPLFVMDTAGSLAGFPGLFVAGIFSAGLSTVSTGLNSLAAIWFAELDGSDFKAKLTDRQAGLTVKLLALGFGLLSFALVFVVPYMSGLAPVAIALSSFFSGALFALFMLGMFVPFADAVGATVGLLAGIGVVGWMTIGAQIATEAGQIVNLPLPLSTSGCAANATLSALSSGRAGSTADFAWLPYRVSFLWYSALSLAITFATGVLVSAVSSRFTDASPASSSSASTTAFGVKPVCWVAVSSEASLEEEKEDARPEKLLVRVGDKEAGALQVSVLGRGGRGRPRQL